MLVFVLVRCVFDAAWRTISRSIMISKTVWSVGCISFFVILWYGNGSGCAFDVWCKLKRCIYFRSEWNSSWKFRTMLSRWHIKGKQKEFLLSYHVYRLFAVLGRTNKRCLLSRVVVCKCWSIYLGPSRSQYVVMYGSFHILNHMLV